MSAIRSTKYLRILGVSVLTVVAGIGLWQVFAPKPSASLEGFGTVTPGEVAATELVNQDHQVLVADSLKGQVWLVNFFFTSCSGPCPLMTSKMALIMKKFPQLHALSITSDPETDTPEVMKTYASKYDADLGRWHFARGEESRVKHFAVQILKLPLGEEPDSHSARIALIDRRGQLIGWYDSQDQQALTQLAADVASSL